MSEMSTKQLVDEDDSALASVFETSFPDGEARILLRLNIDGNSVIFTSSTSWDWSSKGEAEKIVALLNSMGSFP
jgi:hypothetical protein